jgi:hypothetical protein
MKVVSNIFSFIHPETLFIDKISITYNPSKADRDYILAAIKKLGWLETWAAKKKNIKDVDKKYSEYIYSKSPYRSVIDLRIPDNAFTEDNLVLLELDAKVKGISFLRIEYSPSKVPFSVLSACLNDIMPKGIDCIFEKGKVTRLDIAMDIKDVKPYQIILDYMKSRFRTSIIESGRPDSIYIGKDTGENQVYMYDKAKEMKDKNKIKPLSEFQFPEYDITRIELRHRPDPALKFAELFNLENLLFKAVAIYGTPPKIKGDDQFNAMRDLCVLKGIRHVLKQFTNKEHDELIDKLVKFSKPDFIDFKMLWTTLPEALKQVYPHAIMTSISKC